MTARLPREFVAYGFGSTHDALSAEALLADMGLDVTPIPAPAELGALCGIAIRLDPSDTNRAEALLEAAGMSWTGKTAVQDV